MDEYDRQTVERIAQREFPRADVGEVLRILDQYGTETYQRERERVQLAILKLSDGRWDRLNHNINVAKSDYRDVLAWAEYPESFNPKQPESEAVLAEARAEDRRQYVEWLQHG